MKRTIAVFFGGRSAEHDVSIITAHIPIIEALQASGQYEVWPVYISKSGRWYSDLSMNKLDYFQNANLDEMLAKLKPVQLLFDDGLTLVWPGLRQKQVKIEIGFPAMHGTYGEDGTLMGLLRLAGIPFVGCDIEASAVAMDKVLTKQVTGAVGIPSVPFVWFRDDDWTKGREELLSRIAQELTFPLFVKPVHLGSSIAITRVKSPQELENAIEVALHYDTKVIVEQGVENLIEVTLPIMGNGDDLQLALVEQSMVTFFDFEEKYLKGGGKKGGSGANSQYSKLPAEISTELSDRVQELGRQTYRAIGASGIARIDFLIDGQTNEVFMNEINTLPGSLYHHNWRAAGVSSVNLVTRLIALAEERFKSRQSRTFVFKSKILDVVTGPKTRS